MDPTRDFCRSKGTKPPRNPRFHKASKEAVKSRTAEKAKARRKQAKATYNGPRTAYVPDQDTIDAEIAEHEFYAGMCCTGHDIYDLREEHIFMYGVDMPSYMNQIMYSDETREARAMAKLHRLLYEYQFS
jgi:hypothetical protein